MRTSIPLVQQSTSEHTFMDVSLDKGEAYQIEKSTTPDGREVMYVHVNGATILRLTTTLP